MEEGDEIYVKSRNPYDYGNIKHDQNIIDI